MHIIDWSSDVCSSDLTAAASSCMRCATDRATCSAPCCRPTTIAPTPTICTSTWRCGPRDGRYAVSSDRKALAAAARALGVGIVEDEAGGEIILDPVHRAADQKEDRGETVRESCRERVWPDV